MTILQEATAPAAPETDPPARGTLLVADRVETVMASLPSTEAVFLVAAGKDGVIEGKKVRRFVDLSTTGARMAARVAQALAPKTIVESHKHEVEQFGVVVKGSLAMIIAGEQRILTPGDTYRIPAGAAHGAPGHDEQRDGRAHRIEHRVARRNLEAPVRRGPEEQAHGRRSGRPGRHRAGRAATSTRIGSGTRSGERSRQPASMSARCGAESLTSRAPFLSFCFSG